MKAQYNTHRHDQNRLHMIVPGFVNLLKVYILTVLVAQHEIQNMICIMIILIIFPSMISSGVAETYFSNKLSKFTYKISPVSPCQWILCHANAWHYLACYNIKYRQDETYEGMKCACLRKISFFCFYWIILLFTCGFF